MKLSDLNENEIKLVSPPAQKPGLKLSDLQPNEVTEAPSELKSAALGALQGGTLGFADEGEGAIRALANSPNSIEDLKAKYQQYRDIARKRDEEAKNANPKSYFAGNIGGSLATAAIPGLGEMNLAKAVGMGAAAGLGSSNQDLTNGNPMSALKAAGDTAVGGTLGLAGGLIGKGIGKVLAPSALKSRSGAAAIKAINGTPTPKNIPIGNTLVDEGLLPLSGSASDIQQGITNRIGDIEKNQVQPTLAGVGQSNALPGVLADRPSMGQQVKDLVTDFTNGLVRPDEQSITKRANGDAFYWAQKLDATEGNPQALNEVRKKIDVIADEVGTYDANGKLDPLASFYGNLRTLVNKNIDNITEGVSTGAGDDLRASMGTQSSLIGAKKIAGKAVQQDIANPPGSFGLKDFGITGLGTGAALTGHPLAAAGIIAGGAAKVGLETATGQPLSRTANIISARTQGWAANNLATPSGQAVMKGVTQIPQRALSSTGVQTGIQSIYTTQPAILRSVADSLQQKAGTKDIGTALHTAIDNNDEDGKNRVLFAAEQLPAVRAQFRQALDEHLNGDSGQEAEPDEVDDFLTRVGRNESGGGQNFNHQQIQSGNEAGQTAIGTYGLLPNTVRETLNKAQDPKLEYLNDMDDQELKANLESNPDTEYQVARHLAERVLNNQGGDAEKAAFAWRHGHNLPSSRIEKANYQNDDYVKKFNRDLASR